MKPTDFLPIGRFLAKAWSSEPNTQLKISRDNSIPTADITNKIIQVGLPNKYSRKVKIGYRLWRTVIFHEAMHIRFTPAFLENKTDLHDIVEDYRIEELGKKIFKGMKKELKFLHMIYAGRNRHAESSLPSYLKTVIEFYSRLSESLPLFDCFKDQKRFDEAVKFTKEYLDRVNYEWNSQEEIDRLVEELAKILGLEYVSNRGYPRPEVTQDVTDKEIEEAVDWLSERLESLEKEVEMMNENEQYNEETDETKEGKVQELVDAILEAVESIEPSKEVLAELEKVKEEAKKMQVLHESETVGYSLYSYKDPERFIDYSIINRLTRVFKEVKFKFTEVHSSAGSEFDVEGFLAKSRPFLTDTKTNMGNVIVILDMSGSINTVQYTYKHYLVNIGFALKQVCLPFSIYVFQGYSVSCVKSFREPFTKEVAGRLCGVEPFGLTPISYVYKQLEDVIKRCKLMITLTDGEPEPSAEIQPTKEYNIKFRDAGIVSVAITSVDRMNADELKLKKRIFLQELGYDDVVMVKSFSELPSAFAKVLARWQI